MRKLIVSIIILLLLGAAGFVIGWADLFLPPGSHAVVFTKTGGWYPSVVEPGDFTWMWQRLLPTNVTSYVYQDINATLQLESAGSLPSGDLYASVLPDSANFSYALSLDVEVQLTNEAVYEATVDSLLRPDTAEEYLEVLSEEMLRSAERTVTEAVGEEDAAGGAGEIAEILEDRLARDFPEVELLQVRVREARFPDLELYRQARANYFTLVEARREALETEAADTALRAAVNQQQVESLSRIGALLAEHPSLLEYLRFSADTETDPLGIQELFAPQQ